MSDKILGINEIVVGYTKEERIVSRMTYALRPLIAKITNIGLTVLDLKKIELRLSE